MARPLEKEGGGGGGGEKGRWTDPLPIHKALDSAPVLIRLQEGDRGEEEALSFSAGDTMALQGVKDIRGRRLVLAHYMTEAEAEEGVAVSEEEQVYRALLTIPYDRLPDLEVCMLEDPAGDAYRSFVSSHFPTCNWRQQQEQLLNNMEEKDYYNIKEVTLITNRDAIPRPPAFTSPPSTPAATNGSGNQVKARRPPPPPPSVPQRAPPQPPPQSCEQQCVPPARPPKPASLTRASSSPAADTAAPPRTVRGSAPVPRRADSLPANEGNGGHTGSAGFSMPTIAELYSPSAPSGSMLMQPRIPAPQPETIVSKKKPVPSSLADKLNQCLQRRLSRPDQRAPSFSTSSLPRSAPITPNDNNNDDDEDEDVYVEIPDSDDEDDNYDRVDEDDEDDNYDLPLDPPEELQNTAIGKKTERAAGLVSGFSKPYGGPGNSDKSPYADNPVAAPNDKGKAGKEYTPKDGKKEKVYAGKTKDKDKAGKQDKGREEKVYADKPKDKVKERFFFGKTKGKGKAENVYTKGNNPGQTGKTTAAVVKPMVRVAPQEAGRVTLPSSQTTRLADRPPMPSPYNVSPVEGTGQDDMYEVPIKTPLERMTCPELCARLRLCGMTRLADTCRENSLDGNFFCTMTPAILQQEPFSLSDFELTVKLPKVKAGWVPKHS